ncbi:MAG: family 1 glycosylhydrolase, partial [Thermoplasmata archaeon]
SYREIEGLPYLLNAEVEPCENCSDFMWDIYPPGIRIVANNIFEKYRKEMYILENGIADSSDSKRPQFIIDHIKEMEYAINDDKIPIKGYFHWSLIDNYEWAKGFSMRFGLFGVDYKTKKRYKRESAEIYRKICLGEI